MVDNINVRTDLTLGQSTFSHVFETPIENIDVSHWIFNISDAEYQHCAPGDHIAAGTTTTNDGRPMSINVERIGPNLVIEHYIGEILEKRHFKLVSISDNFVAGMHFRVQVNWEISIKAIDGERRWPCTGPPSCPRTCCTRSLEWGSSEDSLCRVCTRTSGWYSSQSC